MNWTLEVVAIPVTDMDRAKAFYADALGFAVDHDTVVDDKVRFVQLTPPGSGCSVVLSTGGMISTPPGAVQGLQLVVRDVRRARAELVERGVDVTEVQYFGRDGIRDAELDDDLNNVGFCYFSDPDGTGWAVQQITARD